MKYNDAIIKIAKELNLPVEVVKSAYLSFWKHIKYRIQLLPLREDITEEEFNQLRTTFNVPSLGKLGCDLKKFKKVKKYYSKENRKYD